MVDCVSCANNCRPVTKCRLGTKCRLQTAKWVQNADWESKEFFRLVCGNLSTYRTSHNHFSVISFHNYLHYCRIFQAHFLIKIHLNIISSLHIVFSLCMQGWLVWCLYRFYKHNKSRCRCRCKWDVTIEYLTHATFEKQLTALHMGCIIIFLSSMCLFCCQKRWPRPKLFLQLSVFSTLVDHLININLPLYIIHSR